MRVLVLDFYYRPFWLGHYRCRPGLDGEAYEAQLASLFARRFGTSDAYSQALIALGHEGREVVFNCLPLQAAWARERGIAAPARHVTRVAPLRAPAARALLQKVLLAQVEEYDPDVVYVQDLMSLWPQVRRRLRRRRGLLVAQIASTAPPDGVFRECDLVITSFPHWVDRLRARGIECEYLPLAFDERALAAFPPGAERPHELSFVGTLRADDYRGSAQLALQHACAELDVAVWGIGADTLHRDSPILRDYRGEAWGGDMYRVLGDSRITLNRHNDIAEGRANNMRLFEATGMGAALLTEAAPNLGELFDPGRELVIYESAEDLVAKARRLLQDDDERGRIAAAGQRRTLAEHTYSRRVSQIVELLEARVP